MNDLRSYKSVVLDALKDLRAKDAARMPDGKGWGWRLKSISKKKIVLRWGYIPDTDISIRLDVDDDEITLLGRMDDRHATDYINDANGDDLFVWVGDKHWHDATTIDGGLKKIISNIGYITRNCY